MENYIVSARKYRPMTFDSVVGQQSITTTLKNAIKNNHVAQAYLFCGPRGVGKTTCARILAKTLNCLNRSDNTEACGTCESCISFNENRSYSIHELDAASNNSVEDIRTLIEQVRIPPQLGKHSVYIIDEVHMLSAQAFNAFLKTLEEPPSHAIFILATTEKHKIIPTILSRCQIFDFNRIQVSDMVSFLNHIAQKESVEAEEDALNIVAQKADGGMRDALSIFDQLVSFCGNSITYQDVIKNLNILDYDYYFNLVDAFLENKVPDCMVIFNEILIKGFDAHNFINGLASHFRNLLVCHDPETINLLEVGANIRGKFKAQADKCSPDFLFQALQISNECDIHYKSSRNQRLHLEITLIKLANITLKKKLNPETKTLILDPDNTFPSKTQPEKPTQQIKKEEQKKESLPEYKSSFSIKKAMQAEVNVVEEKNAEPITTTNNNNNGFSKEELLKKYTEYTSGLKEKKPRMYHTLKNQTPVITGESEIVVELKSDSQKEDFDQNCKQDIQVYLIKELKNNQIRVRTKITENEGSKEHIPYTSSEKYDYLLKKNPNLQILKQEFNLDFD